MSKALKPKSPQEQKWAMTIHLAAFIGLLLPLGLVLGPLIVWMLKKKDSTFLDAEGKKAVNFQLTILIAIFVVALLSAVIRPLISIAFMIGFAGLIFALIAGVTIHQGKRFQYPFSVNIFK